MLAIQWARRIQSGKVTSIQIDMTADWQCLFEFFTDLYAYCTWLHRQQSCFCLWGWCLETKARPYFITIVSSGGHLYAPSLLLLSFNIECTWPWVYWWHLKAHTHARTHTHGTKQVKFVYTHTHAHTRANGCTWHIQVHAGNTGVFVVHMHSCTCTHVHANTHGLHK